MSLPDYLTRLPTRMLEEDKLEHIFWSFWLTLGAMAVFRAPLAFAAVMFIGLLKECWDEYFGSGFCRFDLLANVIGGAVALALAGAVGWVAGLR